MRLYFDVGLLDVLLYFNVNGKQGKHRKKNKMYITRVILHLNMFA